MHLTNLVLVRHGESTWNHENKFTGWTDIDLSEKGRYEAKKAGKILKKNNFIFNYGYTSLLKRAIHTLWDILDELDLAWIPVKKSWRLNERHYGALQGLNKDEVEKKYGEKKIKEWRRSFLIKPPITTINDKNYSGYDKKYANLSQKDIPLSESLKETIDRLLPYWKNEILKKIKRKDNIIIVAHGNSLRGLIKHLDNLNDEEIINLNIKTGSPIVYQFNEKLEIFKKYYLNI